MTNQKTPEIRRAIPELQALAVAVRGDWNPDDVRAAIANAATIGMTWPQVLVALPRLMADPAARPGELIPDYRDPNRSAKHPDAYERGGDLARDLLAQKTSIRIPRKDHP
jgi:hypothetical protein